MNIQKEKGESRFATLAPHIPGTQTREPSTFNFNIDHQIYLLQLKLQHIHHSHLRDPNIFIKLFHISNETWALLVRLAWPISTRPLDLRMGHKHIMRLPKTTHWEKKKAFISSW